MDFTTLPAFDRDFKRLSKRFRTLGDDFEILIKYIDGFHNRGIRTDDPVEIQGACGETYKSYKVRKIACKSLLGRGKQSGLRLIYVYEPAENKITFVEIYYKGDQENEDKARLKEFISELK